jgi:hypothetical protein
MAVNERQSDGADFAKAVLAPTAEVVSELRARGYAVLPVPRRVELAEGSVRLDATWRLRLSEVKPADIAVRTLVSALADEHSVSLFEDSSAPRTISLSVQPGAIETGLGLGCDAQAYQLRVAADEVAVVGNDAPGVFYGVRTLLQLCEGDGRQRLVLPIGTIRDWPRYELRVVHWDTKHHQDRPETLKRFLDWSARFKINAVAFELEDKFEYPSHREIGAPGAFTTEELQGLVRYGLERHIQLIPDVQAPAHLCYVLKHEKFAHLCCDGSNYMICMDDPEAVRLLFDMYEDVCEATEGVDYFLVSTDEVYYAGICEKYRRPYNPVNRSLTWVDYVKKAHEFLTKKGRRVIIWAEYPLLKEHIHLLPPDVINGIMGSNEEFIREQDRCGIRQLLYVPMQGSEPLFPNYFDYQDGGAHRAGRLRNAIETTCREGLSYGRPLGTFSAAWDDSGLHNETFWLGWATMAQCGWTPGMVPVEQTVADFVDIYYGRAVTDMAVVYHDLQAGAHFWAAAWERQPSKVRGPGYGYSEAKKPVTRWDLTLSPPALPSGDDLSIEPVFTDRYARLLKEAPKQLNDNDRLLARLHANLVRATRNRHNLEVFLSLGYFQRHFIQLLIRLGQVERLLIEAGKAHREKQPGRAVGLMLRAHDQVGGLIQDLHDTFARLKHVWEKGRFPKGRSVGDRHFLHVMDDVKDHFADRRLDLAYLIAPEQSIGLREWRATLARTIQSYAQRNGLDVKPLEEELMDD